MVTKPLIKRLDEAIADALAGESPDAPVEAIAKRLLRDESEMFREWVFHQVVRMLQAKRRLLAREARAEEQYQIPLPGFGRLPARIVTKRGRQPIENATYKGLRQYLVHLRKMHRQEARVQQVQSLLGIVAKYNRDTPGITVKEALAKEADRTKEI